MLTPIRKWAFHYPTIGSRLALDTQVDLFLAGVMAWSPL
jgi:hypothetical protein